MFVLIAIAVNKSEWLWLMWLTVNTVTNVLFRIHFNK